MMLGMLVYCLAIVNMALDIYCLKKVIVWTPESQNNDNIDVPNLPILQRWFISSCYITYSRVAWM